MRILTSYPRNRGGGSFVKLVSVMEAMLKKGWEVHYISSGEFPIKNKNLHFHKLPFLFIKEFPRTLAQEISFYLYFWILAQLYGIYLSAKNKIDAFVIFGSQYSFSCLLPKIVFRVPLINFVRGNWIEDLSARIGSRYKKQRIFIKFCMFIENISLLYSDNIYVVTEDLINILRKRYKLKKEMNVFYNGIDSSKFYPRKSRLAIENELKIPKNKFLIGYVGSLDPIKNVPLLVKSFAKIKAKDVFLLIVGKGRQEEQLKKLVHKLNIGHKVIFAGWRKDTPEIISALDLLVLPSKYEGCPGVLLESLGCDTPCIGSNVGGIPEVLKYKDLLFKCSSIIELAKKLNSLMDKKEYNKVKQLCRERKPIFMFDWKKSALERIESIKHN